jgi:hypothetical protein
MRATILTHESRHLLVIIVRTRFTVFSSDVRFAVTLAVCWVTYGSQGCIESSIDVARTPLTAVTSIVEACPASATLSSDRVRLARALSGLRIAHRRQRFSGIAFARITA